MVGLVHCILPAKDVLLHGAEVMVIYHSPEENYTEPEACILEDVIEAFGPWQTGVGWCSMFDYIINDLEELVDALMGLD